MRKGCARCRQEHDCRSEHHPPVRRRTWTKGVSPHSHPQISQAGALLLAAPSERQKLCIPWGTRDSVGTGLNEGVDGYVCSRMDGTRRLRASVGGKSGLQRTAHEAKHPLPVPTSGALAVVVGSCRHRPTCWV